MAPSLSHSALMSVCELLPKNSVNDPTMFNAECYAGVHTEK